MAKPKKTVKSETPAKAPEAKVAKVAKPRSKGKDKKVEKKAPKAKPAKAPKAKTAEKGVPRKVFAEKMSKLATALAEGKPSTFQWGKSKVQVPIDATFEIDFDKEKKDGRIEIEFEIKWKK